MSAGSKIVAMRAVIRTLTPYLDHRADCLIRSRMQRCTCDFPSILRQAQHFANADPARTGGPRTTNDAGAL